MSAATLTNANMNRLDAAALGPQTGELLRLENVVVEDLRGHGEGAVESLRQALAAGVPFTRDPKRKRFYELQAGAERFYIHVLPASTSAGRRPSAGGRKVLLLARWVVEPSPQARRAQSPMP